VGLLLMRFFYVLSSLVFSFIAEANEIQWHPVHMNQGCVQFSSLYKVHPELEGKMTPSEVYKVLKNKYSNVKERPFLTLYDNEKLSAVEQEAKINAEKSPWYKFYTDSNAIFISWGGDGNKFEDGLLFYTEDLCNSLYGKSVNQ
jgi:hypothetical protein